MPNCEDRQQHQPFHGGNRMDSFEREHQNKIDWMSGCSDWMFFVDTCRFNPAGQWPSCRMRPEWPDGSFFFSSPQ
jgi:hypothetical protein